MSTAAPRHRLLDFDIDRLLSRFIPPSFVHRFPQPLSHFLGHRTKPVSSLPQVLVWVWSFIGAFVGILLIGGVYRVSPWIQSLGPPVIVASFGAGAVLEYGVIESPLAQPRNLVGGQVLSATVGVAITKLFLHLPSSQFNDLQWVIGPLTVAAASFAMALTKTIHPPAGATSLLAGTNEQIIVMGWSYIPLVLISSLLMLGSALLVNNIQRRFPQYWWTPQNPSPAPAPAEQNEDKEVAHRSKVSADRHEAMAVESPTSTIHEASFYQVRVTDQEVEVPDWLVLGAIESALLHDIQGRLRQFNPTARTRADSEGTQHSGHHQASTQRASSWAQTEV